MIIANYILLLAALMLYAPEAVWQTGSREFFFLIGVIGVWRYSWGFLHFARSWYFRNYRFRHYRRHVDQLVQANSTEFSEENATEQTVGNSSAAGDMLIGPKELFVIVTSFRIQSETTASVYRSLFDEAIRSGRKVTVMSSIVEAADQRFIKKIFQSLAPPDRVCLTFVRLTGVGKRDSLAVALNAVKRRRCDPDAAVALMDGDVLITPGSFNKTLPFFAVMPEIGGLTTDEDSVVAGSRIMGLWHRLRFAQRQLLMSSLALSGKVLTMTGRFSIFRASIATDPSFIDTLRNDRINHWRLGQIKLLTGDDKSTWFWLMKNGWDMFYVPDVRMFTIEHPPSENFVFSSTMLMMRWFGNMLRSGGRAIALGPKRCGWFVWWCLIDQRLSMWTPLIGPTAAIMGTLFYSVWILYVYIIWVMFTRLIQSLMLLSVRDTISGFYPFLLYFSQIYGSFIKTFVYFRPHRQRWTRQTAGNPGGTVSKRYGSATIQSNLLHSLALAYLVVGVAFFVGLLQWPSSQTLFRLF